MNILKNKYVLLLILTVGYYILYNGIYYLLYILFVNCFTSDFSSLIFPLTYIITLGIIGIIDSKTRSNNNFEKSTFNLKSIFYLLLISIIFRIACDPILRINQILNINVIPKVENIDFNARYDILIIIYFIFLAPVTEELIFRKFFLNKILLFKNNVYNLLYTSFLFALIHINVFDIENTISKIYFATILGFLLGYLYQKYKNIKYPIFLHIFNNLIVFLIMFYRRDYWNLISFLNFNYIYWAFTFTFSIFIYYLLLVKKDNGSN